MKRSIFWNEVARKTRENKVMSVVRLIQRCINCSADTNTTIVYTFRRGNRWCLFPFLAFVPQEQRLKCLVSWLALPQETPRVRDQQCLSRPKFSPISIPVSSIRVFTRIKWEYQIILIFWKMKKKKIRRKIICYIL